MFFLTWLVTFYVICIYEISNIKKDNTLLFNIRIIQKIVRFKSILKTINKYKCIPSFFNNLIDINKRVNQFSINYSKVHLLYQNLLIVKNLLEYIWHSVKNNI
ncbi:hypothetical protein NUSPORA_01988 [Nucleospora cyclopteri]